MPATVAIAVPDETRPFPIKLLLPPLLERIFRAFPQLPHEHVRIVVGGGLHEPPDAAQLARILPENLDGCTVVAHGRPAFASAANGRDESGHAGGN